MIIPNNARFNKAIAEIQNINFQEIRIDNNDYFEAVILKSAFTDLIGKLEENFGAVKHVSEIESTAAAKAVINGFGGIRPGQSLFFLKEQDNYVFAMLWPWQDGQHITLKIFHN